MFSIFTIALPATLRTNKKFWGMPFCHRCPKQIFSPFCFASSEIIGVKFGNRRTDRQTNSYGGMQIFSFSSICYLPTRLARRGIIHFPNVDEETNWVNFRIKIAFYFSAFSKIWESFKVFIPQKNYCFLANLCVASQRVRDSQTALGASWCSTK